MRHASEVVGKLTIWSKLDHEPSHKMNPDVIMDVFKGEATVTLRGLWQDTETLHFFLGDLLEVLGVTPALVVDIGARTRRISVESRAREPEAMPPDRETVS